MTGASDTARGGPDPSRARDTDGLVRELDLLRRRAAYGSSKARIGLAELARLSGVPRSTVHTYVNGMRTPPADVLDRIVAALGAAGPELAAWADALDRVEEGVAATPPPDARASLAVPRDLPPPPGVFVGRTGALATLAPLGEARRLAVLTGTGGMGKTALALHWAHREAARFPDGQLYVDLQGFGPRPPRSADEALATLLRALDVEPWAIPAGHEDRVAAWAQHTRDRRLLVLLDNASDAAQVAPLLGPGGTVTTLVTSRDELTELVIVHDAVAVPVTPLEDADVDELVALAERDDRAGDDQDTAWLAEAMRRCAGMPLALRIVGERWLRGLSSSTAPTSPQELLDEMGLRSTDLGVRSTLGWTLEHLGPEARGAFDRLGSVPQAATDEQLVAVVTGLPVREARLALESLAAVHLVRPTPAGFSMHDLVAAFARERYLAEDDQVRARVEDDLARHVAAVGLSVCRVLGWVPPVDADLGAPDLPDAVAARRWMDRHLDTLRWVALTDTVAPAYRWVAAVVVACRYHSFDPSQPVEDLLRSVVLTARSERSDLAVASLENQLGICCAIRGDLTAAWRHLSVSARRHRLHDRTHGSGAGATAVESNLARLAGWLGRHDEAVAGYRSIIAAQGPDVDHEHLGLAVLRWDLGDVDGARDGARWVVEHQPTRLGHVTLPTAYVLLAKVAARQGRPDEARRMLRRAPTDVADVPTHVLDQLGAELEIAVAEERYDDAAAVGRRLLRATDADDTHARCLALVDLADVELLRHDEEAAAVWLAEARLVAGPAGMHHCTMLAMLRGVRLSHRLADTDAARAELSELRALADTCGSSLVREAADRLSAELGLD